MTAVLTSAPPRFRSVPLHVSSAGQDAIDLAAGAGLELDEWQRLVLLDAMARTAAGKWAALEVALVVPRQNGKNRIIAARQLFGLFLNPRDRLQVHTAHRADTSTEQHQYLCGLIEDTPELLAMVKDNGRGIGDRPSGLKDGNGKESIEVRDGRRIVFRSRTKGSGRGLSGDVVYFDEAFRLIEAGSLVPSLSARPDPQIWYPSSAPLPIPESDTLRGLIRRGRSGDGGRLCYHEWSVPADADIEDPVNLAAANPSHGAPWGGVTAEFAYGVERQTLTVEEFPRERFGIFPDTDDAPQWLVIPKALWGDGVEVDAVQWIEAPTFAVEIEPGDTGACIVAAGTTPNGDAVELVDRRDGTGWLLDRLRYLLDKTGGRPVVVDKGSNADTFAGFYFAAAGIEFTQVETADVVQAAADFVRGVIEGTVVHRSDDDQALLSDSVSRTVKRPYGDVWLFDRRVGAIACPTIGASLALWGARQEFDPDPGPILW